MMQVFGEKLVKIPMMDGWVSEKEGLVEGLVVMAKTIEAEDPFPSASDSNAFNRSEISYEGSVYIFYPSTPPLSFSIPI